MTWWLIPLIIGVVLLGVLVGLLVSRRLLSAEKESFPFLHKHNAIVPSGLPVKNHDFSMAKAAVSPAAAEQAVERKSRIDAVGDDRLQAYLETKRSAAAVKTSTSPALQELESNLAIATNPSNLVNFKVETWNTKRSEFNAVNADLMAELVEAYVDMMLANNVVWLVTELGRESPHLKDSYTQLSTKVEQRLQRIMPAVRDCFN